MNQRLAAALVDRYRLERELGQGGMATVYLAHDLRHDRDVAIKVLREDLAVSLGGGRFVREIRIAAQLQHPHILPLLDSGEADGFLFFAMPYVKGQSLRERLARDGELPISEAVRLLAEVVDALVEAHAHGVVHRDIKPDNVMLSGRHALVTDFGVAKAVSEATGGSAVTTAGVALGTPAYMSPEQAAADPHVDHRSDIYAVGVMAYEMICGRPPFTGTTPQQVLAAHLTQTPDPPSKYREAIAPALDQVILACLAKRPADRFQTAAELLAALEPLATPSTGITPTSIRPMAAPQRRWWGVAIAVGVVAVAAAALLWRQGTGAHSPSTALDRVRLTTSGYAASPRVSPDGKQVMYAERPCAAAVAPHCAQRLVVQDVATGARQVLIDSALIVSPVQWSPSGDWALITLLRSGATSGLPLAIISRLGGTPIPLAHAASFTARGDTVIAGALQRVQQGRVTLRLYLAPWTQPMDTLSIEAPDQARFLRQIRVSPTGRWIASIWARPTSEGVLAILDRQGQLVSSSPAFGRLDITWNAAGTALLAPAGIPGRGDLLRIRVDPRSGALGTIDTLPISANASGFSRSADGAIVAYTEATEGSKDLWTLAATGSGRVPQLARKVISGSALADPPEISGDGTTVLFAMTVAAGDRLDLQLFAAPFAEGNARPVTPPLPDLLDMTLTGDGRRVVVATRGRPVGTVFTAYDVATARVTATVQRPDSGWNVNPAGGGGDVVAFTPLVALILDESLREVRRSTLSDSTGTILIGFGAPAGRGLGVVRVPGDFATVIGEDFNMHVPIDTVTTSGGWGQAGMLVAILIQMRPFWQRDGSMLYIGKMAADPAWAIYRLPPRGGAPERLGPIPVPDNPALSFSSDFRRGVVLVTPVVSDIWLLRNFAPAVR